jgi:hypothetical protein
VLGYAALSGLNDVELSGTINTGPEFQGMEITQQSAGMVNHAVLGYAARITLEG